MEPPFSTGYPSNGRTTAPQIPIKQGCRSLPRDAHNLQPSSVPELLITPRPVAERGHCWGSAQAWDDDDLREEEEEERERPRKHQVIVGSFSEISPRSARRWTDGARASEAMGQIKCQAISLEGGLTEGKILVFVWAGSWAFARLCEICSAGMSQRKEGPWDQLHLPKYPSFRASFEFKEWEVNTGNSWSH